MNYSRVNKADKGKWSVGRHHSIIKNCKDSGDTELSYLGGLMNCNYQLRIKSENLCPGDGEIDRTDVETAIDMANEAVACIRAMSHDKIKWVQYHAKHYINKP